LDNSRQQNPSKIRDFGAEIHFCKGTQNLADLLSRGGEWKNVDWETYQSPSSLDCPDLIQAFDALLVQIDSETERLMKHEAKKTERMKIIEERYFPIEIIEKKNYINTSIFLTII
jgi:hypothetical protein